jgi:hypothetical protein
MEPIITTAALAIASAMLHKTVDKLGDLVWDRTEKLLNSLRKQSPETVTKIEKIPEQPENYDRVLAEIRAAVRENSEIKRQIKELAEAIRSESNYHQEVKKILKELQSETQTTVQDAEAIYQEVKKILIPLKPKTRETATSTNPQTQQRFIRRKKESSDKDFDFEISKSHLLHFFSELRKSQEQQEKIVPVFLSVHRGSDVVYLGFNQGKVRIWWCYPVYLSSFRISLSAVIIPFCLDATTYIYPNMSEEGEIYCGFESFLYTEGKLRDNLPETIEILVDNENLYCSLPDDFLRIFQLEEYVRTPYFYGDFAINLTSKKIDKWAREKTLWVRDFAVNLTFSRKLSKSERKWARARTQDQKRKEVLIKNEAIAFLQEWGIPENTKLYLDVFRDNYIFLLKEGFSVVIDFSRTNNPWFRQDKELNTSEYLETEDLLKFKVLFGSQSIFSILGDYIYFEAVGEKLMIAVNITLKNNVSDTNDTYYEYQGDERFWKDFDSGELNCKTLITTNSEQKQIEMAVFILDFFPDYDDNHSSGHSRGRAIVKVREFLDSIEREKSYLRLSWDSSFVTLQPEDSDEKKVRIKNYFAEVEFVELLPSFAPTIYKKILREF